jgi:hypothetical protein
MVSALFLKIPNAALRQTPPFLPSQHHRHCCSALLISVSLVGKIKELAQVREVTCFGGWLKIN